MSAFAAIVKFLDRVSDRYVFTSLEEAAPLPLGGKPGEIVQMIGSFYRNDWSIRVGLEMQESDIAGIAGLMPVLPVRALDSNAATLVSPRGCLRFKNSEAVAFVRKLYANHPDYSAAERAARLDQFLRVARNCGWREIISYAGLPAGYCARPRTKNESAKKIDYKNLP